MSFSQEWENRFSEGSHISTWPWSDLVAYVHRYASPKMGFHKVLEIGCGVGANIPFFRSLGSYYCAVEGSASAVDHVQRAYPDMRDRVRRGDFTVEIPFDGPFDLIVDRSAMISNSTAAMERGLSLAAGKLRVGGKYIAIDWFSNEHSDSASGTMVDANTRTDIPEPSHLHGIGPVHFSDRDHIEFLLNNAGLRLEHLEHKLHRIDLPDQGVIRAWWNFVAAKPA